MKNLHLIFILLGLLVVLAYAPVNATGSKIIMPVTQWKDSTSLVRGYTGTTSPTVIVSVPTNPAVSVLTPTYADKDNGKTVSIAKNSIVKVQLEENPTTGYSWNTTVSSGMQVISSSFQPSGTGRFGAGGTHTWVIRITGTGLQQFSGNYNRPWLQASPDDPTYVLSFNVR